MLQVKRVAHTDHRDFPYRVIHLVVHLSWVDFDLDVPPSCLAAQLFLWNTENLSQPNPGARLDESPYRVVSGVGSSVLFHLSGLLRK